MKRIGILTAGGDTPALNATVHGAVVRANQGHVEVFGFIKGYSALLNPSVPYVHLNPLFTEIPELDPARGGTVIGASRAFVDPEDRETIAQIADRLKQLKIDGLICVGGDGTLNGLQPFAELFPVVLAPKTIDNDLGLNHRNEPDEWEREPIEGPCPYRYKLGRSLTRFELDGMVNYVTPGYATAVFDTVTGMQRVRTTAESHRRIGIVEVMGRHSGYIALGAAYGQPDIILVPEVPVRVPALVERVHELYELQKNVIIVCGEGIVGEDGRPLGAQFESHDPAGNVVLSGAAEALRSLLIDHFGDAYFQQYRRSESAQNAIFTRKVGHTQRGGRPVAFDRFHAAQLGGKAVDMLLERRNNAVAILQWNHERGFYVDSYDGNAFRDRWGVIHARFLHPSFYDEELMRPSKLAVEYMLPIFTNAIGQSDIEAIRQTVFDAGSLFRPYHSVNTDINKRIRYLQPPE
jgi:6-phosphofructokinase 1